MSRETDIIDAVLKDPNLLCMNVRHDENSRRHVAATLITKGNSEWARGIGITASEAILDLEKELRRRGFFETAMPAAIGGKPTMPGMPSIVRKLPGM